MKTRALRIIVILSAVVALSVAPAIGGTGQTAPEKKPTAATPVPPRSLAAHLVGHAHIDLSWLWRWEETVADIATFTFKGTLAQMDKLPGLTFAQSQAAIYEAMEKDYPDLFQRIARKVKEGTWVPVGGMWVEPDLNMPDGESLARQLLYGKRYFLDKFGVDVKVGWNPDSFGHNWQLPQILRRAGIDSYVFGRCAPGPDPTHIFWWEGMDGSRVLGYVPPGWYNVDLRDGVRKILEDARKNTDVKGGVMRLSVIHGATAPDPEADRGRHELLYSILPHRGDWKAAETTRRGRELGRPLIARVPLVHGGTLPKVHSFVRVGPGNVILSALKKEMGYAERGLVLRLYEIHGEKTEAKLEFPWPVSAEETDLIERPSGKPLGSGTAISVPLGPYEIKTIRIELKRG